MKHLLIEPLTICFPILFLLAQDRATIPTAPFKLNFGEWIIILPVDWLNSLGVLING
jgi:hypothetical protein